MAFRCSVCGKGPVAGKNVSHSNRKTPRRFKPNLQRVRIVMPGGAAKRVRVCTRCIKAGKVRKAA